MPHFNDQYPSMEEIERENQREITQENNKLLKEQNKLLRELLGRPNEKQESNKKLEENDLEELYRDTVSRILTEKTKRKYK